MRPHAPWYNDAIRAEKQKKLERKWLKSKLAVDEQAFRDQCRLYKEEPDRTKTEYHCAEP